MIVNPAAPSKFDEDRDVLLRSLGKQVHLERMPTIVPARCALSLLLIMALTGCGGDFELSGPDGRAPGGAESDSARDLAELQSCLSKSFASVTVAPFVKDETLSPEKRTLLLSSGGPGFVDISGDPRFLIYVFNDDRSARAFSEAVDYNNPLKDASDDPLYVGSEALGNKVLVRGGFIGSQLGALRSCGLNSEGP